MKELQILNQRETLTSLEIAELTNKEHNHVMRDIRNIVAELGDEIGTSTFGQSSYTNSQNKILPMYVLDKKASLILASGYNVLLRAKIIDRWEELENSNNLPKDYLSALKALVVTEEERQVLLLENEKMKPKAEFFDAVTESKDCCNIATVAKILNIRNIGRNKLFEILRDKKVLQHNNQPMQSYVDRGWFKVIETKYNKPSGDICINFKTVVFQKGIEGIRKILTTK